MIKRIYKIVNRILFRPLLKIVYGDFIKHSTQIDSLKLLRTAFFQKLLGFNRSVPWPVHFTSLVLNHKTITIGSNIAPGLSIGCYIQGSKGIKFGSNIWIGPHCVIASANHDMDDYTKHTPSAPIEIGDCVWIGANSVILPGVKIGNNVIIGAGSIVTKDIPENSIAAGNPCKVIKSKPSYKGKS
jgi:acetyltransferase-like isoleucine patch superfamily enzyme